MDKKYFTPDELAERWNYNKNTLAAWRSKGKGPKWGRRGYKEVVYLVEDVLAFEQEQPYLPV